jgi:hypothetical protein
MGWRSSLRHIRAEGRKQDKKSRREERKLAKEEQIIERRGNREERKEQRKERGEQLKEERRYIKTRNLPHPYIGEIRYGYDIPHKRQDNCHKYVYKHCAQSDKYEWIEIDKLLKLYIKSKEGKVIKLVGYDGGIIKELAENEYINSRMRKKN